MMFDDTFTDVSDRNKVLGIIISVIATALLIYFFKIGILLSIFLFFVIMITMWMGSTLDNETPKGD